MAIALALILALSNAANAYIPPCGYMIKRMTKERPMKRSAIVYLTIFKPAESSKSTDQLLGEKTYLVSEDSVPSADAWPTLSMALYSNAERLTHAIRVFGLAVPEEKELLRFHRDQYTAMKEIPRPFYVHDKEASLHRYRNSYAWSCENDSSNRSIWIEKDTFVPLELRAPCPASLGSGDPSCSVELQNMWNLHETKNARILLKRGGKNLFLMKLDHVIFNPTASQWHAAKESNAIKPTDSNLSTLDIFLH